MDFGYLLELAKQNKEDASKQASVKRYSTALKPSKKEEKGYVRTSAIKAFLARKDEEEKQKEKEAYYKKEELLSLRAKNSKSCKKAKLMASRTKDNDFSKIKLSEDEEVAKKKREMEIQKRMIADKIERMKARIQMEEQEKLLPRKRKRKKTKSNENVSNNPDEQIPDDCSNDSNDDHNFNNSHPEDKTIVNQTSKLEKKTPRPSPPTMNFHDLLQLASKKQHEPIKLPKIVKKEERPMTKKERRQYEEQQLRKKGVSVYSLPPPENVKSQKSKQKRSTSQNLNISKTKVGPDTTVSSQVIDNSDRKQMNNKNIHQPNHNSSNSRNTVNDHSFTNNKKTNYSTSKSLPGQSNYFQNNNNTHKHALKYKNECDYDDGEGEEDYEDDDDLSDFLDDEPIDEDVDISHQIQEIFGYDKRRYVDDDDDIMETSFAEQMKEECRSARIGRMEDLEDIQREQEEFKRKKLLKKR